MSLFRYSKAYIDWYDQKPARPTMIIVNGMDHRGPVSLQLSMFDDFTIAEHILKYGHWIPLDSEAKTSIAEIHWLYNSGTLFENWIFKDYTFDERNLNMIKECIGVPSHWKWDNEKE